MPGQSLSYGAKIYLFLLSLESLHHWHTHWNKLQYAQFTQEKIKEKETVCKIHISQTFIEEGFFYRNFDKNIWQWHDSVCSQKKLNSKTCPLVNTCSKRASDGELNLAQMVPGERLVA